MTRFLLVRHGETDWNVAQRHQGQADIPLNENGGRQAQAVAEHLKNESINVIYASDLARAWKTAEIISEFHAIPIEKETRLREMSFGEWEGLTYEEICQRNPSAAENWNQILMGAGPPDGESLPKFAARIQEMLDEIIAAHHEETLLLVAHGGTLMVLVCLLLEHPLKKYWQFRIEKASLSEIEVYPEGAIINYLNDTSHLKMT